MSQLSDKARQALAAAQTHARQMQHARLDIPHLLLALLELDNSAAQQILVNVGLKPDAVRAHLAAQPADPEAADRQELAPNLKRVLRFAVDFSRRRGHPYVGTEHLLLALAQHSHPIMRQLLATAQTDGDRIRQRVESMFEAGIFQEQGAASPNRTPDSLVDTAIKDMTGRVMAAIEPEDWQALARIARQISIMMRDATGPYHMLLLGRRYRTVVMTGILEELLRRAQAQSWARE